MSRRRPIGRCCRLGSLPSYCIFPTCSDCAVELSDAGPARDVGFCQQGKEPRLMASFVSANLDHELSDNFVVFKLDAKVRFEPKEVGHRWLVQIEFMEEDPVKDDKLSSMSKAEAFGQADAHLKRHYIIPSKEEVELSFSDEFPKHLVDTEVGKEEVYAKLQVLPLEAPPGFVAAKTRTNVTVVDV